MGNDFTTCDKPQPNTENLCSVSVGDRPTEDSEWGMTHMPNFCTILGVAGNSYRREYCRKMSDAGEWGDPETKGGCSYNDCNYVQLNGVGCCGTCCGIAGGELSCRRLKMTGDPLKCCFNDYDCTKDNDRCFSDDKNQNTCPDGKNGEKNYRSMSSPGCREQFFKYCTGTLDSDDPDSTEWLNRWVDRGNKDDCTYVVRRNIFLDSHPEQCAAPPIPVPGVCNQSLDGLIAASNFFWASTLISAVVEKYNQQGFILGSLPGTKGFNPFQDLLYDNICCPYAGICQDALENACATNTAQRISFNPELNKWCGCHLPAAEYLDYSSRFNVDVPCTPMCNKLSNIPVTGINGTPLRCEKNICIIDDVNVNLVNAQIGGGISFAQVCGSCPEGECSCIIDNTTVDVINSTIDGNFAPIGEGCGGGTKTQTNPGVTGPKTIDTGLDQNNFNPYQTFEEEVAREREQAFKSSSIWTMLLISFGMIIVYILIYHLHPKITSAEKITVEVS